MIERQLIAKGEYKYYQTDEYIRVKQYIFLRTEGKKCLSLRFTNPLDSTVDGMKFILTELDVNGSIIRKRKIRIEGISFGSGSEFAYDKGIIVDEKCVDFKVTPQCAYSGRYRYKIKNDELAVYYVPHRHWAYKDSSKSESLKVRSKAQLKIKSARLVTSLLILALLIVVLSPVISYYGKIILFNVKRMYDNYKVKREAEKEARRKEKENVTDTAADVYTSGMHIVDLDLDFI